MFFNMCEREGLYIRVIRQLENMVEFLLELVTM